ncbi:hypothetical protein F0562_024825 [Nyssa sinensis]|uniref:Uncharacterized protein n=1 Tax=Nyssa sinensis TaxID=561372 RepID=A0A5J5BG90_9ASTE|nr:hypothetical protein F0562_024825 [Nyssa sinensis]
MGNNTEFEKAVLWLSENLTFDVDARINLFECNIRVLGGLVSAHILATDPRNSLQIVKGGQQLLQSSLKGSKSCSRHNPPFHAEKALKLYLLTRPSDKSWTLIKKDRR